MKIIHKRINGVNVPYESYETKAECLEALRGLEVLEEFYKKECFFGKGTYYLHHSEYSRPEYNPQKYGDGWGIKVREFYYAGTFNAPKDRRINIRDLVKG